MSSVPKDWQDQIFFAREIPERGLCGVQHFAFTSGLLTGLTFNGPSYGYTARYCYPNRTEAFRALLEWDGVGDPPGDWVKEKVSERFRVPEEHV